MIRIGLVGYGYWGPNLARAAAEIDLMTVEAIADFSPAARERAGRRHPSARLITDWQELVRDPAVDAVMIATPVNTHFDIAARRPPGRQARAGREADGGNPGSGGAPRSTRLRGVRGC